MVPAPKTVPLESSLVSWKLQGAVLARAQGAGEHQQGGGEEVQTDGHQGGRGQESEVRVLHQASMGGGGVVLVPLGRPWCLRPWRPEQGAAHEITSGRFGAVD